MDLKYIISRVSYRFFCLIHRKVFFNKDSNKQKVFLFGTVEYMNYGDVAINQAEVEFIRKYLPKAEVVEIPERLVLTMIPYVRRYATSSDIIAFQGGGNMGDIWPAQEELRRSVFKEFKEFKIISFPQSLSYSDSRSENLDKTVSVLTKPQRLSILIRESLSFKKAKQLFPENISVTLVPDIVMSLSVGQDRGSEIAVSTFMRVDQEKINQEKKMEVLRAVRMQYMVNESDTVDATWKIITPKTRGKLLDAKLDQFRKSNIILTDRLHGMIFALITGTPAIVFDNNNHKVKFSYLDWLQNVDYIYFAGQMSKEEIMHTIAAYQHDKQRHAVPSFDEYFKKIGEILIN
ncbi:polysaccharide pyruvyl transferase family protein [Lacticaseibacillus paracasei]|uniref:polysaccharide pyruvyl transferase family protein n=1 Tax=Lacticaseibacillus paracasei TaxID=1597 RepID=UPI0008DCE5A3|nr:polysaccharide pyruvyl transferase family protein [Lacticaseibacillus paracasei]OHY56065.1 exopolysaccharide pyruvyl transferase [Lacticaseibacillus paracasei]